MQLSEFKVRSAHQWPHVITDNFFTDIDFQRINEMFGEHSPQTPRSDQYGLRFVKKFRFFNEAIDVEKLAAQLPVTEDLVDPCSDIYNEGERIFKAVLPFAESCLARLYPEKLKLFEFAQFQLVECAPNFQYRAHEDAIWKILSIVVFISPTKNEGTIMLKSSDPNSAIGNVEWRKNRAFIFSRIPGITWHRYRASAGQLPRRTVVFNLCTTQKEALIEIEARRSIFSLFKLRLSTLRNKVLLGG